MALQEKADAPTTTDTSTADTSATKPASAPAPTGDAAKQPAATGDKPAGDPAKPTEAAKPTGSTSIFDDDDDGEQASDTATRDAKAADADAGDDGDADGDKADSKPAAWEPPDDWRERLAKGDEKHLAELKRFKSWDSWMTAQRDRWTKFRAGELGKPEVFDEKWDDAKKTEWRKANGVPEKADGYQLPEVKGHEWTDGDQAAISPFLERMHARNARPEVVQEALGFYAEALANAKAVMVENDRAHRAEVDDAIRDAWGPDYKANKALMKRALEDVEFMPGGMGKDGVGAALMSARLPDGRRLVNMPGVVEFLAGISRERYGEGAMIPASETAVLDSRENEIVQIMNSDIDRYYREKNSKGQTLEAELREIRERKNGGGKRRAA